MNQPTIIFEGKEYPIGSIHWHNDGNIAFVGFYKEDGEHVTALQKTDEIGYDGYGLLRLDLEKRVKWGLLERVE